MVCIMPTDLYLDVNWLSEMVVYNSFIERSGIGIISAEKQGYYTNLLTTGGDLEYLAVPDLAGVRGCLFFDQSLITSLGAFNEGLHSGWQFTDYAERAGRCGYNNYFIPMKNAVPVDMVKIEPWHTTEQQYKAAVKKLPLFIKLSDFDSTLELAFKAAEKLVDAIYVTLHLIVNEFQVKVELIENRNNNNFMLRLPVLTERELNLISKFAERHNVKWFVRSDDQFVLCVFTNKNQ